MRKLAIKYGLGKRVQGKWFGDGKIHQLENRKEKWPHFLDFTVELAYDQLPSRALLAIKPKPSSQTLFLEQLHVKSDFTLTRTAYQMVSFPMIICQPFAGIKL